MYYNAADPKNPLPQKIGTTKEMQEKAVKEAQEKASKSQGEEHRSDRANMIQAAKEASLGKFGPKEKKDIEKKAHDKLKAENPGLSKGQLEDKLKELVAGKGLGKLVKRHCLPNGRMNTIRASQIKLATDV